MSNERRNVIAQYMFQEQGYDETYAYKMADELLLLIDSSCPAGGGWIPVSERLPEEGVRILYYFKSVGMHVGRYKRTNEGDVFYGAAGYLTDDVTHWRQLPEPPERDPHAIPPGDDEPPEPDLMGHDYREDIKK